MATQWRKRKACDSAPSDSDDRWSSSGAAKRHKIVHSNHPSRSASYLRPQPPSIETSCSSTVNFDSDSIKMPVPIDKKAQLSKIRISRTMLEKWCHAPFFKKTVLGAFVRIGFGNDHSGNAVYRVAQVIGVVETARVYQLGGTRTNKALRLRYGAADTEYGMEFVSNQDFTDSEFCQWMSVVSCQKMKLPTTYSISRKQKDMERALQHNYTDKEIDEMLAEKQRFSKSHSSHAMQKAQLLTQMSHAHGNVRTIAKLQASLDKLEGSRCNPSSLISKSNRRHNVKQTQRATKKDTEKVTDAINDPFTRRACLPMMVTQTSKAVILQSIESQYTLKAPEPVPTKVEKVITPSAVKTELRNIHDCELDVDIAASGSVTSTTDVITTTAAAAESSTVMSTKPISTVKTDKKRTLTLDDYRKRVEHL